MLNIDIQRESDDPSPGDAALGAAVNAVLEVAEAVPENETELSIRIVSSEESRALNARFRGRDKATNVLSFPARLPPGLPFAHFGDIVICSEVVRREALEQRKSDAAHWAHMIVHGTLHLLGYDHVKNHDAKLMESLETQALKVLGWPCPYVDELTAAPGTGSADSSGDPADTLELAQ